MEIRISPPKIQKKNGLVEINLVVVIEVTVIDAVEIKIVVYVLENCLIFNSLIKLFPPPLYISPLNIYAKII